MIKKIRIRDFQVHKKLVLDFGPGVTSIVGPSDVGKSAIFRALKWVVTNRPLGKAFIRDGAEDASVEVSVDEGVVTRQKGKGGNCYLVDGRALSAMGDTVPNRVSQILNLSPTNFQGQFDAPFWFSDTAGEVSRSLNQIVDLGVMDQALAYLSSELRMARTTLDVVTGRVEKAREEKSELSFVPGVAEDLAGLEKKQKELLKTRDSLEKLRLLCAGVQTYTTEAGNLAQLAEQGRAVLQSGARWAERASKQTELEGLVQRVERQTSRRDELTSLVQVGSNAMVSGSHWQKAGQEVCRLQELVAETERYNAVVSIRIPDITGLEALGGKREGLMKDVSRLKEIVGKIEGLQQNVTDTNDSYTEARRRFRKLMGDQCVLCGQRIVGR